MYQQQVATINAMRMLADALAVIAAGYAAYFTILAAHPSHWTLGLYHFVGSVLIVAIVNNYILGGFGLYGERKHSSYLQMLSAIFKTVVFDFALLAAVMLLSPTLYAAREFFFLFLGFSLVLLAIVRTAMRLYYERPLGNSYNLRRILIVGDLKRGSVVAEILQKQLSWGHEIIGNLSPVKDDQALGHIDELPKVLRSRAVDEVIFALDKEPDVDLRRYLNICRHMGIQTRILPSLWSPEDTALHVERCQGVPFLVFNPNNFNATGLLYKRLLDIAGGLVGLAILLIILPWVGLAIKLDSPGPIFFKQKRVGQNGRVFGVYKFRSMYGDAEARKAELMAQNEMQGAMFKIADDPRITRVGRFIRKTSIDEIPQFLNVLKGEMSLVGTRPPTLDEVETYEDWHYRRISAKPGITGMWQVSGRNKVTDFNLIVELDCSYLDNWRFIDDLRILLQTVWVVLRRKGAV